MRDCIFLFADEAFWAGDKAGEGQLKLLITERHLPIEAKGRDVQTVLNMLHVMIASNSDWVVPATAGERRFAMFDVSPDRIGDEAYWTALNAEIENGGAAAFLEACMSMELAGWHPRRDVPQTKALIEQIELSDDPARALVRQCLMLGAMPGTHASYGRSDIIQWPHFRDALNKLTRGAAVTDTAAGLVLAEIIDKKDVNGGVITGKNNAGKPIFNRCTRYFLPSLAEARRRFDSKTKWPALDVADTADNGWRFDRQAEDDDVEVGGFQLILS